MNTLHDCSTKLRVIWLMAVCIAVTSCSGSGSPAAPIVTSQAPVSAQDQGARRVATTPAADLVPASGPLSIAALDAQAAAGGLTDVAHTYSTDASNTVLETGGTTLGSLRTTGSFVDSSVIAGFVASYAAPVYVDSRIGGGAIGAYFNAGGGAVFDSHGGYVTLGTIAPNLTAGATYYAKFDTLTSKANLTKVTLTFLNTAGSAVFSQSFSDTDAASQGARGPADVALQSQGIGVSRIAVYGSVQPNSVVLQSPTPAPAPVKTQTPAPVQTATPAPTSTPAGVSSIPQGIYESCPSVDVASQCLADLDTFKGAGFTRVVNYSQLQTTAAELSTYLSHAASDGIAVIISVKDLYATTNVASSYPALAATCPSSCTTSAQFAAYVAGIAKANAGTWGYYIGDETPVSSANESATAAIYHAIKAVDPNHPILFVGTEGINTDVTDLQNAVQPFASSADVLGVDHYSIGAGDTTGATQLPISQAMHTVATSDGKPSVLVLQAFGWAEPEYNTQYCNPYPACGAFPTEAQMRTLSQNAVRGDPNVSMMLWYSFMDINDSSAPQTNLQNLSAVVR